MNTKIYCYTCGTRLIQQYIEEENKTRKYCPSCRKPIYENPIPSTAVVAINDKNELLLVLRKVEPKAGQWCLPGGYLEMEETPENGSLRELKEETGLEGEVTGWAGNILAENIFYKSVIVMGYIVSNIRGKLTPSDDCIDAKFFPIDQIPPIAFRSHREILSNALKLRNSMDSNIYN